jgi:hypothetical protein
MSGWVTGIVVSPVAPFDIYVRTDCSIRFQIIKQQKALNRSLFIRPIHQLFMRSSTDKQQTMEKNGIGQARFGFRQIKVRPGHRPD